MKSGGSIYGGRGSGRSGDDMKWMRAMLQPWAGWRWWLRGRRMDALHVWWWASDEYRCRRFMGRMLLRALWRMVRPGRDEWRAMAKADAREYARGLVHGRYV